jgi:GAF domain-containing protein
MAASGQVPLEDVITTAELARRPSRAPDYERENRALSDLMDAIAAQPQIDGSVTADGVNKVLDKLVETALDLCRAHSAGVSILEEEDGRESFRWRAAAGAWSIHRGDRMARDSPCGTVLDRNEAILMSYPERHFAYAQSISLPIAEALLIPFHQGGKPVGTIWVLSHDETRRFDAEDYRVMASLGRFAATAFHLLNERRLANELTATLQLQEISTQLLTEEDVRLLNEKILDAARAIMRSDFASIQKYYPEGGEGGALELLGHRGLSSHAARFWEFVDLASNSACGAALRQHQRVVIPDTEACDFIAGDLEVYRQTGIRAMQTTPLLSRSGQTLGMLSTHWKRPHQPVERDLRLFACSRGRLPISSSARWRKSAPSSCCAR